MARQQEVEAKAGLGRREDDGLRRKPRQEVEVNTRLGRRRISMDKVIYFPRGLAGFEEEHEFTLLVIRQDAPMLVLQSMRDPTLGLLVADPYSFLPNYSVTVGDAEQKLLRLKNVRQVAVLVTVSIPPGQPNMTALNLTGPILVNHKMRIGLQVPQTENAGPAKFYLHPGPDGHPRSTEVTKPAHPVEGE